MREGIAQATSTSCAGSNDEADAQIVVDGQTVHVEMFAYRQDTHHREVEPREPELRRALVGGYSESGTSPGLRVYAHYREDKDSKGQLHFAIPGHDKFPAISAEFKRLVEALTALPIWLSTGDVEVTFGTAVAQSLTNPYTDTVNGRGFWIFLASDYPHLASVWSLANIRLCGADGRLVMVSGLMSRHLSADQDAITKMVGKKLGKVKLYRKRAGGSPCWLVIHSASHPLSACIDPDHIPSVCEAVGLQISQWTGGFDAAFWLDMSAPEGAKRLYRVCGASGRPESGGQPGVS